MKIDIINFRIHTDLKERIKTLARDKNQTVSEWLLDRPELAVQTKPVEPLPIALPAASASSGSTGRKCIQPGCTIQVSEPVLIAGMKAWVCQLHA